ncbi:MAG: aldo/keto reductase [Candidatus Omnitrophica bacterium]|nr:aldo/keto reductase [Candidatus Omnitrophota bacterium]
MNKVILGTAQFGLDYGISNKRGKIPHEEVFEILNKAIKSGIDTFDTAYNYAESEKVIGDFVKIYGKKIKIISKLPACSHTEVKDLFYSSLSNLNASSLEGYLIHNFESYKKDKKVYEELAKLKEKGKIAKIGFSLNFPSEFEAILESGCAVDLIQLPFNVFDRRFEHYFAGIHKRKIEIHARSIFLQGLVFKKPSELGKNFQPLRKNIEKLHLISEKSKIPLSDLCFNFVSFNKYINRIVIGIDSLTQLNDYISQASHFHAQFRKFYPALNSLNLRNEKLIVPACWEKLRADRRKSRVVAVIQARTGSTRLPGKVLLNLEGKTVLEHVIERVKRSELVDEVMVATTILKGDSKITALCKKTGIKFYRGSKNDVLDRYYQSARLLKAKHIVRITADCPVSDSLIIDKVIKLHLDEENDYTRTADNFPDGIVVEVFTFKSLQKAWREAILASEREHVTPYLKKHQELFKQSMLQYPHDFSKKRWTLDEKADYKFLRLIYKKLYKKNNYFGMKEILKLLAGHPEYEAINNSILRNEGYLKSLREDKIVLCKRKL